MKLSSASLVATTLVALVKAGDDWTNVPACAPVTVTQTVQQWQDVATQTIYITSFDTTYLTSTETQVQYKTDTVTDVQYQTDTITVTYTAFDTVVNVDTLTAFDTVTAVETQQQYHTETQVQTNVDTVTVTITEQGSTVTIQPSCTTSSSLTGLVLCPSRTVNPTYTPKAPLPTDYHWGCKPGTLCTPKQIDCNFEQSPPDVNYVCSPDECLPTPPLPEWAVSLNDTRTDADCAWYEHVPGYPDLDPRDFGLTYDIFDIFGQPLCPAPEPAPAPAPVPAPAPAPAPSPTWSDWSDASAPPSTPTKASGWTESGRPPRKFRIRGADNPLAALLIRQNFAKAPPECYGKFNSASRLGMSVAYARERFCPDGTPFQNALGVCRTCLKGNADSTGTLDSFPKLQEYVDWCRDHPA